jgi:hypothetical protein
VGTFRAKQQPLRWVAQQVFAQYPNLRGKKCYVTKRVRTAGAPGGWADWPDFILLEDEAQEAK